LPLFIFTFGFLCLINAYKQFAKQYFVSPKNAITKKALTVSYQSFSSSIDG